MGNRRQIILTRKTGRKPFRAAGQRLFSLCVAALFAWLIVCPVAAQPVCTVTKYNEDTGMSQWHVTQMLQDKNGLIWFSTWNGLDRFDGHEFVNFKSRAGDGSTIPTDRFRDMRLDDSDGSIYLKADDEWYVFQQSDGTFHEADKAKSRQLNSSTKGRMSQGARNHSVRHRDPNGYLWTIGTDGGLYYEKEGTAPTAYPLPQRFADVNFYMADRQGNLWLLCAKDVFKLSFSVRPATHFPLDTPSQLRALFVDRQQRYWAATKDDKKLRIFDSSNQLLGYVTPSGHLSKTPVAFGASIYCITQTSDGTYWMGSKPDGLFRLRETEGRQFAVEHLTGTLPCHNIYDLKEDRQGRLWIATMDGGLWCLPRQKGQPAARAVSVSSFANLPQHMPQQIRFLHITHDNTLLAATTDGLLVGQIPPSGDIQKMQFWLHRKEADRKESLSCNATMDVLETPDHRFFISTESGGVNEILSSNILADRLEFRHYNKSNGLNSDIALSLTWHEGQVIVVSSNQLLTLQSDSGTSGFYNASFFHESFQFSEAHPQQLPDGRWVFCLTDGGISLPSAFLRKSEFAPPIVLTGIDTPAGGTSHATTTLRQIELTPEERSLTVFFAALDYHNPEAISYAYRLGADTDWNYIGHNRAASFANLEPGRYELQLRSTNGDGVWVDNLRTFTIVVNPTFLEAWYGQLLLVLIVSAIVGLAAFTFLYIRRLNRRQHETLEKYLALVEQSGAAREQENKADADANIDMPAGEQLPSHSDQHTLKKEDAIFMDRVIRFVEMHIADPDASIGDMADAAATSRSGLNRKMKSLVGLTPADFMREARIKRACQLLTTTADPVSDIAYRCGFTDPKYFGKCFKASVGTSPTEYRSASRG